jgi:hypothetical protein
MGFAGTSASAAAHGPAPRTTAEADVQAFRAAAPGTGDADGELV